MWLTIFAVAKRKFISCPGCDFLSDVHFADLISEAHIRRTARALTPCAFYACLAGIIQFDYHGRFTVLSTKLLPLMFIKHCKTALRKELLPGFLSLEDMLQAVLIVGA